jgi:hypothetical protein
MSRTGHSDIDIPIFFNAQAMSAPGYRMQPVEGCRAISVGFDALPGYGIAVIITPLATQPHHISCYGPKDGKTLFHC